MVWRFETNLYYEYKKEYISQGVCVNDKTSKKMAYISVLTNTYGNIYQ